MAADTAPRFTAAQRYRLRLWAWQIGRHMGMPMAARMAVRKVLDAC